MPLKTLCYACQSRVSMTPGEVFTCDACFQPQIAIEAWDIGSSFTLCPRLRNHAGIMFRTSLNRDEKAFLADRGVTFLIPPADFPAFVDTSVLEHQTNPAACFSGCAWGASYYHLSGWPESSHHKTYLIYPLFRLTENDVLFHGTTSHCANGIMTTGKLLPPSATGEKTHGFPSERDIRYVGLDKSPADDHDKGALIELEYTGWVLDTHLGLSTHPLHSLHERLPADVPAIQFHERGRAIAFRIDAVVTPKDTEHNRQLWDTIAPPRPTEH
ncbi:hypothetical protein [Burkholderia sp. IMCC1007]|uniref:hypothetical protein n=1 Tax=Burkholderia sp. IMCC1007 TaxID=3004104 RepID=UPI0022B38D63|nr:hypothetical protein [Burkholderia sp. IMCC1007]